MASAATGLVVERPSRSSTVAISSRGGRGPLPVDRVLALDTLYVNAAALVIVLDLLWGGELLFEAALLIALLGFVSTVALARYVSRGNVVE